MSNIENSHKKWLEERREILVEIYQFYKINPEDLKL